MHYYIDGYNLLFRIVRAGENLQTQREIVIQDLSAKIKFLGLDATIVFDAQYQVGEGTKTHLQDLEILFTAQGETADESIINELKSVRDPRHETVVTSDKKLAWRARRKAAHSESVEEFMDWLNRRYKNKIRTAKQEKRKVSLAPKEVLLVPPPKKEPHRKMLAEECTEYYAEIFEKKFEELPQPPKKNVTEKNATEKKKPPKAPKDTRSDFDRWLDIFEVNSSEF